MLHAIASPLIKPSELSRLHSLEVAARIVVEGVQTGAHRSPHKGHSVDFADHRQYVPGDDIRHLDWKVLGRSDRLVLKRYEAETDLGCTMVIDGSASMSYHGSRADLTKYRYASMLAASLSYLVLGQQDRAGLVLFNEQAAVELKVASQGQLQRICRALEGHKPSGKTDAQKGLEHLLAPSSRRGLVIMISDFLADPEAIRGAVERLRQHGHDLAMVWVLDPDELDLGVSTVSRFEGLEGDGDLTVEPRALRAAYEEEVSRHRLELQKICHSRRCAFIECQTIENLHLPLNRLLVALHADKR
jgi:uncharacterized protein (DUF58 family)